jgi:hypothetical protein
MSDSTLSIDSLLLAAEDHAQASGTLTPDVSRRANPFNKAMGTLRYTVLFTDRYSVAFAFFSLSLSACNLLRFGCAQLQPNRPFMIFFHFAPYRVFIRYI